MGMFDWVNYECVCPVCHNKVDGFQSDEVDNFYSSCRVCGAWIEFDAEDSKRKHSDTVKFIMRPVSKERTKGRA